MWEQRQHRTSVVPRVVGEPLGGQLGGVRHVAAAAVLRGHRRAHAGRLLVLQGSLRSG